MTETHAQFSVYSGSTWQFDAALHDAQGNPLNLAGAAIAWRLYSAAGSKVMELTVGSGIEVTDAGGGLCRITVPADQTKDVGSGSYRDEIVVTLQNDFVSTQAVGLIVVNKPGGLPVGSSELTDPCAILARLQNARLALATGGQQTRVKIENYEIDYGPANESALNDAIRHYESLCRKQTGKPPNRFAIGSTMRGRSY